MANGHPRIIRNIIERRPAAEWKQVPKFTHGIYCLLNRKGDVVYVGMARGNGSGVRSRLKKHMISKVGKWTHFSIFQFWENRAPEEIVELEGLFRHLYRFDKRKKGLQRQVTYSPFRSITHKSFADWPEGD